MSAVRSGEVVKPLPFSKFCFKVDVTLIAKQLIEFLLVGSVRSLDLAIQLRRPWLDVGMSDALVLDVPVELGLELMAPSQSPTRNSILDNNILRGVALRDGCAR